MRDKFFAVCIILFAAAGFLLQVSAATACEADSDFNPRCVSWRIARSNGTPSTVAAGPAITQTLVALLVTNTPAVPPTWTPLPSLTPIPSATPTFTLTPRSSPTARFTLTFTPIPTDIPSPLDTPIATDTPIGTDTPFGFITQFGTDTPTPAILFSPSPTFPLAGGVVATATRPRPTATVRVTPSSTATAAKSTGNKSGDSPFAAIEVSGTWEKINANSIIWYKTGTETSYPLRFSVALDAYGRSGINFAVFSPEQANDLNVATSPKGRGAHDKSVATHDLVWIGGSPLAGIWYILVNNSNPFPIEYKLISTLKVAERKKCFQYWEMLKGSYILWTECNR